MGGTIPGAPTGSGIGGGRRIRPPELLAEDPTNYAVVLQGHNRSAEIAASISAWCEAGGPRVVIAVDDCSRDSTHDVLRALSQERSQLRVVHLKQVEGPWEAFRHGLAELPPVDFVHLPPLEAQPQLDEIQRALEQAPTAGVVFAPREQRSALGTVLERPGEVWGDAPWSATATELGPRLSALPSAFELAPSAWIRRELWEQATRRPDRGAWTAEAWVQRAAAQGGLAYWPASVSSLSVRPERLRDVTALADSLLSDFDALLAEFSGDQQRALATWRPFLLERLDALRTTDRACVAHGLETLADSPKRRERWLAAGLRRALDL